MGAADQPNQNAGVSSPSTDALAQAALAFVRPGMTVGLGTGRAAARFVRALGAFASRERAELTCVSTSEATTTLAMSLGLRVVPLAEVAAIDVLVDGADEVDPNCRMIKGGGGAMTRERIVAHAAKRCVYLIDDAKLSPRLGTKRLLPIEVLPLAAANVERTLREFGLVHASAVPNAVRLAASNGGAPATPLVTDNQAWVLDVALDVQKDAELSGLDITIKRLPGVIDHGLFLIECDTLIVEDSSGGVRTITPPTRDRSRMTPRP